MKFQLKISVSHIHHNTKQNFGTDYTDKLLRIRKIPVVTYTVTKFKLK